MNPLSDLERLVAAIEHQGANIAPTYQEYMPIAFATANDCGEAGRTFFQPLVGGDIGMQLFDTGHAARNLIGDGGVEKGHDTFFH